MRTEQFLRRIGFYSSTRNRQRGGFGRTGYYNRGYGFRRGRSYMRGEYRYGYRSQNYRGRGGMRDGMREGMMGGMRGGMRGRGRFYRQRPVTQEILDRQIDHYFSGSVPQNQILNPRLLEKEALLDAQIDKYWERHGGKPDAHSKQPANKSKSRSNSPKKDEKIQNGHQQVKPISFDDKK